LRSAITNALNSDIISICETHLRENNFIKVEGYTWYGFNSTAIHRNAPKASGGVGILVKKSLTEYFSVVWK
jgi:exonuclease III